MLGETIKPKILPQEYDVFVGLDVDKKSIDATMLDHNGSEKHIHLPHKVKNLLSSVRRQFPGKRIAFAYEAGPTGYGWHDQLTEAGYPCLVLAPAMIPQIPGRFVKTNRLDSQKIGVSLRGGELRGLRVPSMEYRDLRHLTQLREAQIREQVAVKCRIKAMLTFEGLEFPFPNSQWSQRVIRELSAMDCERAVRFKLNQLITTLQFLQDRVMEGTREIRRMCQENTELRRDSELLRSVPGVGWIVAMHLMARLGDWRHVQNGPKLASFLGLVPRERSTGEIVRRGRITRTGDERVRNKLIQAAWIGIQKDPELKEFYERIYQRHPRGMGAKKAITAVANKMCRRIACVLREQRPYVIRSERKHLPSEKTRAAAER